MAGIITPSDVVAMADTARHAYLLFGDSSADAASTIACRLRENLAINPMLLEFTLGVESAVKLVAEQHAKVEADRCRKHHLAVKKFDKLPEGFFQPPPLETIQRYLVTPPTSEPLDDGGNPTWLLPEPSPPSRAPSRNVHGSTKLAIIGMAGRFPDAASHEKLWKLLEEGLDVHRVPPGDRFTTATYRDSTTTTSIGLRTDTPYGCFIDTPGLFDPRFFNMSPREASTTDPMQRMALTTAYETLEMSGYIPDRKPSSRMDRIGTFHGQSSDDWRQINAAEDVDFRVLARRSLYRRSACATIPKVPRRNWSCPNSLVPSRRSICQRTGRTMVAPPLRAVVRPLRQFVPHLLPSSPHV